MFTARINLHPSQVKIGLYVPHDPHIIQPIEWKNLVLNAAQLGAVEMRKELEKHGRDMRKKVRLPAATRSDVGELQHNVSWTTSHHRPNISRIKSKRAQTLDKHVSICVFTLTSKNQSRTLSSCIHTGLYCRLYWSLCRYHFTTNYSKVKHD